MMQTVILKIENLCHRYERHSSAPWSLQDINISLTRGKTLGIVGESGSGKSTLAKAIVRLIAPTSGSVIFNGQNLSKKSNWELKPLRKKIQFLFQNADAALNPRMCIRDILSEPVAIHGHISARELDGFLNKLLASVQLDASALRKFPFEFSGGQRQRINIIRALAAQPELLVCDEPFSALDASTQVCMIDLFQTLQKETGLSVVLIGHDLPVVAHLSDEMAVMQGGRIIERNLSAKLCKEPTHPYTQALFSAIPRLR